MSNDELLVIKGDEVRALLEGQERQLMQLVQSAYLSHFNGESSLPPSTFLSFPHEPRNRVIALPAYLGGRFNIAGIKWISSFPGNHVFGLDRAAAVVILNSVETGRANAVIEASVISAKRTAASAALAAKYLQGEHRAERAGMIGCVPINFEIARFLLVACPEITTFCIFDSFGDKALWFKDKCAELSPDVKVVIAGSAAEVLETCALVSIATNAGDPHILAPSNIQPGSTLLHVSLRDLSPEVILSCDNIVDDIDHVCRAQTSLHLTEQLVGHREFIRCTLAEVLGGTANARRKAELPVVFSPFGLGVLDLAVSEMVYARAGNRKVGTIISSFQPEPWNQKTQGTVAS